MSEPNRMLVEILIGSKGMMNACAGCSFGGCCGTEDHGILAKKAVEELQEEYGEQIEAKYVDADQVGLASYPKVKNILTMGYRYPVILINGQPRLAGALNLEQIKGIIEEAMG